MKLVLTLELSFEILGFNRVSTLNKIVDGTLKVAV
jgi:hypothetical protein